MKGKFQNCDWPKNATLLASTRDGLGQHSVNYIACMQCPLGSQLTRSSGHPGEGRFNPSRLISNRFPAFTVNVHMLCISISIFGALRRNTITIDKLGIDPCICSATKSAMPTHNCGGYRQCWGRINSISFILSAAIIFDPSPGMLVHRRHTHWAKDHAVGG